MTDTPTLASAALARATAILVRAVYGPAGAPLALAGPHPAPRPEPQPWPAPDAPPIPWTPPEPDEPGARRSAAARKAIANRDRFAAARKAADTRRARLAPPPAPPAFASWVSDRLGTANWTAGPVRRAERAAFDRVISPAWMAELRRAYSSAHAPSSRAA